MSNSSLVTFTKISKWSTNPRNKPISVITIHHTAGNITIPNLGNLFNGTRDVSANYGINGKNVGLFVDEKNRSHCSSNADNDNKAITIEVANNGGAPNWSVSDESINTLINLCVDICKRNNIKQLNYTGNKNGNLTTHDMFTNTECPGKYLKGKLSFIASEVNKKLAPTNQTLYRVQVGAFSVKANAEKLMNELKSKGYDAIIK